MVFRNVIDQDWNKISIILFTVNIEGENYKLVFFLLRECLTVYKLEMLCDTYNVIAINLNDKCSNLQQVGMQIISQACQDL